MALIFRLSYGTEKALIYSDHSSTGFIDPVTDLHRTYVLEFEKVDDVVVLTTVSFDNRMLSHQEMRSFAEQIKQNYGKHISPKYDHLISRNNSEQIANITYANEQLTDNYLVTSRR
jgi:type IV secretory pathway ATPase VirB11/archaellum biosynthesis ATPase